MAGLALAAVTVACGEVTTTPTTTTDSGTPATPAVSTAKTGDEFPHGVENISWDNRSLNMDVEKWPVTAKITEATYTYRGRTLHLQNNCSEKWVHRQEASWSKPSVGNYWVIGKVNGQWHGATVDWTGVNRQGMENLKLDGHDAMNSDLTNWRPKPGDEAYAMISTHARAYVDTGNLYRTQIVKLTINP